MLLLMREVVATAASGGSAGGGSSSDGTVRRRSDLEKADDRPRNIPRVLGERSNVASVAS